MLPRHDPARVDRWLVRTGRTAGAAERERLRDLALPDDPGAPMPPLAHRDYSIASVAASGAVELLVRQTPAADGRPGIGSGWLTATAPVGAAIALRLRDNPGFAPPADAATPLILIGNGTDLAGLIAHLRHRRAAPGGGCWLLYGERSRATDRPFAGELAAAKAAGVLTRTDLAFSRDDDCGRYVQHLVAEAAGEIADWVARGAAIYVCGSLAGMASGVDAALRAILGDARLERLAATAATAATSTDRPAAVPRERAAARIHDIKKSLYPD